MLEEMYQWAADNKLSFFDLRYMPEYGDNEEHLTDKKTHNYRLIFSDCRITGRYGVYEDMKSIKEIYDKWKLEWSEFFNEENGEDLL